MGETKAAKANSSFPKDMHENEEDQQGSQQLKPIQHDQRSVNLRDISATPFTSGARAPSVTSKDTEPWPRQAVRLRYGHFIM